MKKQTLKFYNKNLLQYGGKKIDYGSFGCVIKPAILCNKRNKNIKLKPDNNYISKLLYKEIENIDKTSLKYEMKIYKILKNIDPKMNYFIIPIDNCYLDMNKDYKDIKFIKYYRDKCNEINYDYEIKNGTKKKIDVKEPICYLDKGLNPINIILPYGGISIENIINNSIQYNKSIFFIKNNIERIFHHLCKGLQLLHNNKIVHLDIKPDNILFDISKINATKTYKNIKYIDFGLSTIINKFSIHDNSIIYSNIGTNLFMSIDMIISYNIYNYNSISLLNNDLINFIKDYKDYKDINFESYLNLNISNIKENIIRIKSYIDNNSYEKLFIKNIDGFVYKYDIYALGITIIIIIEKLKIKASIELKDLLIKMTNFNPISRLNIEQVLNHPYFTKKK